MHRQEDPVRYQRRLRSKLQRRGELETAPCGGHSDSGPWRNASAGDFVEIHDFDEGNKKFAALVHRLC